MNTLKLLFSGMTAIIITFFLLTTTIDQPFEEKRIECIINAATWDMGNAEIFPTSTGAIFSGSVSPETEKKIKLCSFYNAAHFNVTKQFVGDENWKKIFVAFYAIAAIVIFGMTLWWDIFPDQTHILLWDKKKQKQDKRKI